MEQRDIRKTAKALNAIADDADKIKKLQYEFGKLIIGLFTAGFLSGAFIASVVWMVLS